MKSIYELTADISHPNSTVRIRAKQGDKNTRFVYLTITDNGIKIKIPEGSYSLFNVRRSDGRSKGFKCEISEQNEVIIPLHSWVLALEGEVSCDVSVTAPEVGRLTTFRFMLEVEKSEYSDEDVLNEQNYDILTTLIQKTEEAVDAEKQRAHAESSRVTAENERTAAELERSKFYEGFNTKVENCAGQKTDEGGEIFNILPADEEGVIHSNTASAPYTHAEGQGTISSGGEGSHSEGYYTTASGINAHAENAETVASGSASHAEGWKTQATGPTSHAEGNRTYARSQASHAEGINTRSSDEGSHSEGIDTEALSKASHAEGNSAEAKGTASHAEGDSTQAIGNSSHAEGSGSIAEGEDSHAEGLGSKSYGLSSHAEGSAQSHGERSHAEGTSSKSYGLGSHAEGISTIAGDENNNTAESGAHAEGKGTVASGVRSHAEGYNTTASGQDSHAEGNSTTANGAFSHAEGKNTLARAYGSHTEGLGTIAGGHYQHVIGQYNQVDDNDEYTFIIGNGSSDESRNNSFTVDRQGNAVAYGDIVAKRNFKTIGGVRAEGDIVAVHGAFYDSRGKKLVGYLYGNDQGEVFNDYNQNTATGQFSHAEGWNTQAPGFSAHAEGHQTIALADGSHAEGIASDARGIGSHAEGHGAKTEGVGSHAEGHQTEARGDYQHVEGEYNIIDDNNTYAHIVGNGKGWIEDEKGATYEHRSNAYTLDWNGNAVYAGKVTVGADPTEDMDLVPKKYVDDLFATFATKIAELEALIGKSEGSEV